jgi:riboflavin kinase/FMN adenylyltransferase
MRVWKVTSLEEHPPIPQGSIICLGFFDGFHRGHQALVERAQTLKKPVVILTFDRNPKWNRPECLLTPPTLRLQLFEQAQLDGLMEIQFNDAIRQSSPMQFIQFLQAIKPHAVISGSDFKFGFQAQGNVALLKKEAPFKVIIFDDVLQGKERISSSRIFQLLEEGKLIEVNQLLGRSYCVQGQVGHGFKKGRTIGFPTANIMIADPYCLPKTGVYLTEVRLGTDRYVGMANLGFHPTINALKQKTLEVHLFDFDRSIYDQHVEVRFLDYLREERKFQSIEDLKQQLLKDAAHARKRYEALSHT